MRPGALQGLNGGAHTVTDLRINLLAVKFLRDAQACALDISG